MPWKADPGLRAKDNGDMTFLWIKLFAIQELKGLIPIGEGRDILQDIQNAFEKERRKTQLPKLSQSFDEGV